jgi:predicted acetyltransferase
MFLPEARAEGLEYVKLITDTWNFASQRVIEANGGIPDERFVKPPHYGRGEALLYRIALE